MPTHHDDYEEKYHRLIGFVRKSRIPHGDCKSGSRYGGVPKACAACMASISIDNELQAYKGRPVFAVAVTQHADEELRMINARRKMFDALTATNKYLQAHADAASNELWSQVSAVLTEITGINIE